jgi:hypothetical protein
MQRRVAQLAAPCGPDAVYRAIQPALILYGPPDFGKDKAGEVVTKAWVGIYTAALKDLPLEALESAVSRYIANGDDMSMSKVRFPTPAQLNLLAKADAERIRKLAWRLRVTVETAYRYTPPPKRTPEELEAVARMKREAVAKLRRMPT